MLFQESHEAILKILNKMMDDNVYHQYEGFSGEELYNILFNYGTAIVEIMEYLNIDKYGGDDG